MNVVNDVLKTYIYKHIYMYIWDKITLFILTQILIQHTKWSINTQKLLDNVNYWNYKTYVHLLILRSTRKLSLQNSQIHKAIISEWYSKYEVKIEYITSNELTQFNINKVQQQ